MLRAEKKELVAKCRKKKEIAKEISKLQRRMITRNKRVVQKSKICVQETLIETVFKHIEENQTDASCIKLAEKLYMQCKTAERLPKKLEKGHQLLKTMMRIK